jgi:hypothetical protein
MTFRDPFRKFVSDSLWMRITRFISASADDALEYSVFKYTGTSTFFPVYRSVDREVDATIANHMRDYVRVH